MNASSDDAEASGCIGGGGIAGGEELGVGIVFPEVRVPAMLISERLVAACVHGSIRNT